MALKNKTLLEIYNKVEYPTNQEKIDIEFRNGSFYKFISDVLGDVLRGFISKSSLARINRNSIIEILRSAINDGLLVPLESDSKFKIRIQKVDPIRALNDKNITGIDGGAFSIKFHPIRLIMAKSAVFMHTQKLFFKGAIKGVWRTSVSILRKVGNMEEQVRRRTKRLLVELESRTVLEIIEEYDNSIDAIFWDGPLYGMRFFDRYYEVVRKAKDYAIPVIKLVKNSFASRITSFFGLSDIFDADLFSMLLDNNERSTVYLLENKLSRQLPESLKPVFFYVKTPNRLIVRYEFPYWVIEDYGLAYILRLIYADMQLGGGISYVLSKADQIARFTDQEKRRIIYHVISVLKKNGLDDILLFNERRWSKFFIS